MKQNVDQVIKVSVDEAVKAVRRADGGNYYRVTERLLFGYKKLAARLSDKETYMEVHSRSKSITAATTGSGYRGESEKLADKIEEREASYQRTEAQYRELEAIIAQFQDDERFVVVRMYYFGEDGYGNDMKDGTKWTLDAIADVIGRSLPTVRNWRSRLVEEITVQLFGIDGALSIENHAARRRSDSVTEPSDGRQTQQTDEKATN